MALVERPRARYTHCTDIEQPVYGANTFCKTETCFAVVDLFDFFSLLLFFFFIPRNGRPVVVRWWRVLFTTFISYDIQRARASSELYCYRRGQTCNGPASRSSTSLSPLYGYTLKQTHAQLRVRYDDDILPCDSAGQMCVREYTRLVCAARVCVHFTRVYHFGDPLLGKVLSKNKFVRVLVSRV